MKKKRKLDEDDEKKDVEHSAKRRRRSKGQDNNNHNKKLDNKNNKKKFEKKSIALCNTFISPVQWMVEERQRIGKFVKYLIDWTNLHTHPIWISFEHYGFGGNPITVRNIWCAVRLRVSAHTINRYDLSKQRNQWQPPFPWRKSDICLMATILPDLGDLTVCSLPSLPQPLQTKVLQRPAPQIGRVLGNNTFMVVPVAAKLKDRQHPMSTAGAIPYWTCVKGNCRYENGDSRGRMRCVIKDLFNERCACNISLDDLENATSGHLIRDLCMIVRTFMGCTTPLAMPPLDFTIQNMTENDDDSIKSPSSSAATLCGSPFFLLPNATCGQLSTSSSSIQQINVYVCVEIANGHLSPGFIQKTDCIQYVKQNLITKLNALETTIPKKSSSSIDKDIINQQYEFCSVTDRIRKITIIKKKPPTKMSGVTTYTHIIVAPKIQPCQFRKINQRHLIPRKITLNDDLTQLVKKNGSLERAVHQRIISLSANPNTSQHVVLDSSSN